jgi:DNA-binding protein HU-beta
MTKSELIVEISNIVGSKKDAEAALDAVFTSIKQALAKGEEVRLTGFGSFKVNGRAARIGRNPRTGQEIKIAASKAPAFRPGKELKDAVNA